MKMFYNLIVVFLLYKVLYLVYVLMNTSIYTLSAFCLFKLHLNKGDIKSWKHQDLDKLLNSYPFLSSINWRELFLFSEF